MNSTMRARGRYLAALGLTGVHAALAAVGCAGSEPATAPTPVSTAEGAAPTGAVTAAPPAPSTPPPSIAKPTPAPGARHTSPWVPTVEVETTRPRPGMAACPHAPFCVPQPADPGASPAPAPNQSCADTVPIPAGMGPTVPRPGKTPGVTFDAERTAAERAADPAACCYQWHVLCVGGRALRGPEGALIAATVRRDDWLAAEGAVDVGGLAPATKAALAAHWEREAAFEHASVAAFAHASLALLAVGGPPDLLAATHEAALDEVEHARLAYGLASAYGGSGRGPGALPAAGLGGAPSLVTLARDTFVDGCAGEAAAALALREAAATARDGAVSAILARIAEDEERHAELAWRTVAWALRTGGEEVAGTLREAAAALVAEVAASEVTAAASEQDLAAHGALGETARRAVRSRAVTEVVIPCLEALLASAERYASDQSARVTFPSA